MLIQLWGTTIGIEQIIQLGVLGMVLAICSYGIHWLDLKTGERISDKP